jgi:hypothetical protein
MPDALQFAKEMKSGRIKGTWEVKDKGKGVADGEKGGKKRKGSLDDDDDIVEVDPRDVKKRRVVEAEQKKEKAGKRARNETASQASRENGEEAEDVRGTKTQKT